eukprot:COSAG01_NODE_9379_length_2462_cov_11.333898_4_plen_108_part_01
MWSEFPAANHRVMLRLQWQHHRALRNCDDEVKPWVKVKYTGVILVIHRSLCELEASSYPDTSPHDAWQSARLTPCGLSTQALSTHRYKVGAAAVLRRVPWNAFSMFRR